MGKRFGRNQKRRMREQIADLEAKAADAASYYSGQLRAARRQLEYAEARAFDRFMADRDRYEAVCARLAHEVGRVAGENLRPYAEQLMREAAARRPMVRFDARASEDMIARIITVEWPAVRYNYAVMP